MNSVEQALNEYCKQVYERERRSPASFILSTEELVSLRGAFYVDFYVNPITRELIKFKVAKLRCHVEIIDACEAYDV